MSGWGWFVFFAGAVVVGSLAVGAWVDHQARRQGRQPMSAADVSRAVRDAKREARGSRSRLHIGSGAARRSPVSPSRPRWDDRPR